MIVGEKNEHLDRVVSVFGLSTNIINITVGAGIFALPAIIAAGLGAASIFAYLFCGFLITLVMLCFAEAGSRLTGSGGAYLYIKTAFGPYFGFLTSVLFIIATISADAAVANAFVDIIASVFPTFKSQAPRILTFVFFFSAFGYINVKGMKNGLALVKVVTVFKLIPLIAIVLLSWGRVSMDNLTITSSPSFSNLAHISLILFFAFQGAESGLSISGEVKDPQKNIPKSILLSIVVILVLYMSIQTVAQGVLGDSLATFKENPLGAVANHVFGPIGFTIMTFCAAFSMVAYLSSSILSMPRILFQASVDNIIPLKHLTRVHDRFRTPHISIIAYAFAGFLFASIGGFEQLAIIASATLLLIYLGVSLAVIKFKREKKGEKGDFKIPGGITVPVLSSVTILYLLSNLALKEMIVISSVILLLTIIYFAIIKK
ncbi:Amino acid transporter [Spirosomataceae bacterium TFI 002]|nr:Amino acid transporter [Spirosomataceae bacterium TFI 002]